MGEWIKDLSKYDYEIKIELNAPMEHGGAQMIHIQNKRFRMEMSDKEFAAFASYLLRAKDKLLTYKGGTYIE